MSVLNWVKMDGCCVEIAKVGETAGKEYQIEVALNEMETEWKDVELDLLASLTNWMWNPKPQRPARTITKIATAKTLYRELNRQDITEILEQNKNMVASPDVQ